MKVHYEIEQGTEAWHEIRYGKIGGTLASGLFVKSDNILYEILAEQTEPFEMDYDSFISADMQRGIELEPLAKERLSEYTGVKFINAGWIQCEENSLLGISPDGISEDETVTCEIKCPGKKAHLKTILSNDIPLDHINQCLHYFVVNPKLKRHFFCSFRPESIKPMFVKELTPDSLINIGTNAKPLMLSIAEAVIVAKGAALSIAKQVEAKKQELLF